MDGVSLLTNVNPASIQAFHGDIESLSLLTEPVGHWNGTILKYDRSGRLRVPAHLENKLRNNRVTVTLFCHLVVTSKHYIQTLMNSTFFSFLPKLRPGVPFSTTKQEMPFGPLPPVLHITT